MSWTGQTTRRWKCDFRGNISVVTQSKHSSQKHCLANWRSVIQYVHMSLSITSAQIITQSNILSNMCNTCINTQITCGKYVNQYNPIFCGEWFPKRRKGRAFRKRSRHAARHAVFVSSSGDKERKLKAVLPAFYCWQRTKILKFLVLLLVCCAGFFDPAEGQLRL